MTNKILRKAEKFVAGAIVLTLLASPVAAAPGSGGGRSAPQGGEERSQTSRPAGNSSQPRAPRNERGSGGDRGRRVETFRRNDRGFDRDRRVETFRRDDRDRGRYGRSFDRGRRVETFRRDDRDRGRFGRSFDRGRWDGRRVRHPRRYYRDYYWYDDWYDGYYYWDYVWGRPWGPRYHGPRFGYWHGPHHHHHGDEAFALMTGLMLGAVIADNY